MQYNIFLLNSNISVKKVMKSDADNLSEYSFLRSVQEGAFSFCHTDEGVYHVHCFLTLTPCNLLFCGIVGTAHQSKAR